MTDSEELVLSSSGTIVESLMVAGRESGNNCSHADESLSLFVDTYIVMWECTTL